MHLIRPVDDFVIYIRKIHGKLNLISAIFQISPDNIKNQGRHRMPDVRFIVNGGSAYIHLYFMRFQCLKRFFFSRQRIVYLYTHRVAVPFLFQVWQKSSFRLPFDESLSP